MGNKGSSKAKHVHDYCNCDLYNKYNHCCIMECLGTNFKDREDALYSVLTSYNAEYLISKIMEYLPAKYQIQLQSIESSETVEPQQFHCYSYEPLNSDKNIMNRKLCNIWLGSKFSNKIT